MKKLKTFFLLVLLISAAGQSISQNYQNPPALNHLGNNYWVAGPRSSEVGYFQSKQRCQNWCWAACVQMVLNYHGLYVTQEQVVQRIHGGLPCVPGRPHEIMNALSGWAYDVRGRYSTIYSDSRIYGVNDLIYNLSWKWPIIVGLQNPNGGGHAYVMTAIYYRLDAYKRAYVDKVVLRDPWPGSLDRQEMRWSEFVSRNPVYFKVWVQRH